MLTHSYLCHLSSHATPLALRCWVQMAMRPCNQSREEHWWAFAQSDKSPFPSLGLQHYSRGLWVVDTPVTEPEDTIAHTRRESAIVLDKDQQNVWPCTFYKVSRTVSALDWSHISPHKHRPKQWILRSFENWGRKAIKCHILLKNKSVVFH